MCNIRFVKWPKKRKDKRWSESEWQTLKCRKWMQLQLCPGQASYQYWALCLHLHGWMFDRLGWKVGGCGWAVARVYKEKLANWVLLFMVCFSLHHQKPGQDRELDGWLNFDDSFTKIIQFGSKYRAKTIPNKMKRKFKHQIQTKMVRTIKWYLFSCLDKKSVFIL